jgi:hypothetical protein
MSNIEKYKSSPPSGQVSQFDADLRIADALCTSELMPDAYRGSIPNTLIAIDVARGIGASILQVCTESTHHLWQADLGAPAS